jgi:hypothetical protein
MVEDDDTAKQPCVDECGSPDPAPEVAAEQVSAVQAGEDRISRCCPGQLAVLGEGVEQERCKRDGPSAGLRFRVGLDCHLPADLDDHAMDGQHLIAEVDVGPSQA